MQYDVKDCVTTGKRRFGSSIQANSAVRSLKRSSRRSTTPIRAYFCKDCNGWHLTHEKRIILEKQK